MRIHQHFSVVGFCNTYIVGDPTTNKAILIDPGHADYELIRLLEHFGYTLEAVLLTHRHSGHTEGLALLKKLYDFAIYAYNIQGEEDSYTSFTASEPLQIGPFQVIPHLIGGHSQDSVIYQIGEALFCGDTLGVATLGTTHTNRLREKLKERIIVLIGSLNAQTLLFPGHGSPSTIQSELLFNQSLR